jgi:plastocyanin
MSKKLYVLTGVGLAVTAASAGLALASADGGPIVRTPEQTIMVPNALEATTMHFEPAAVTVKSGGTVTFVNSESDEPHTVTVVNRAELPRTQAQVENCAACRLALGHLKNPRDPENSPIKTYVLDKGAKGFDTRGDSVFLAPKGPHKRATVTVTAPAGTTLYYLCAVHPWMQGQITVTG